MVLVNKLERTELVKTAQLLRRLIRMMIQDELREYRTVIKNPKKDSKYIVRPKSPAEVKRDQDKNLGKALGLD